MTADPISTVPGLSPATVVSECCAVVFYRAELESRRSASQILLGTNLRSANHTVYKT